MKSQAGEAFASTGQDISSLKSCPSLGRAALDWNPHVGSVLYTSELKTLYYSACITGVQRVSESRRILVYIPVCTPQSTHHRGQEQGPKGMVSLSAGCRPEPRAALPSHDVPHHCHSDAGRHDQLHQGLLRQVHGGAIGTAGSRLACYDTESTVSTVSLMAHVCGSSAITHHPPSLSA